MNSEQLIAISSVVIAIAVALISRRQWLTGRDTLKQQLFERRYAIYESIAGFLAEVLQAGKVMPGHEQQFLRDTRQAYFVFGGDAEVRDLVSTIYKHAVNLHALEAERPHLAGQPLASIEEQRKIKDSYTEFLASLENRFEKYLRLEH